MISIREFLNALRQGKFTSVGGYPIYFITADGSALSYETACAEVFTISRAIRDNTDADWRVIGVEVNWEDPNLYCAHSGERIESAYAEESD